MKKYIALVLALTMLAVLACGAAESFSFGDVKDLTFEFSSGAGAWATVMTIEEDGTFAGAFHDSNMGETGEGYPNGTVYYCRFHGNLTVDRQLSEYAYGLKMELVVDDGQEDCIEDGIFYIAAQPYGLEHAKELVLYMPGTPVAELPDGFVDWCAELRFAKEKPEALPYYGLYNASGEYGFTGYPAGDDIAE